MSPEKTIARIFGMTDDIWARHANPWSVWTRYTTLPLLAVSVWSRAWIGWWAAVPVILSILWVYLNPRVFSKSETTNNWASKSVLGERVWLNRKTIPVPSRHYRMIYLAVAVSAIGAVVSVYGLIALELWPTIAGILIVIIGKTWFLDLMVKLYEEMIDNNPDYRSWMY